LRSTGHSYAEVHDGGIDMVVAEASIHYRRPLRFDDEFVVECRLGELARASFTFSYRLLRDGQPVADGFTRHACVDRVTMRPVRRRSDAGARPGGGRSARRHAGERADRTGAEG